ncbi:Methylsterol monooxygenase [Smittium mucronatum]|uniref:Methylsterol monooxygenase n=1 Tax=Smittium mucronatum TaxID=133383 RepID=A0A1R0H4Q6_9FUNG|nr:Methylsterol monooxygenase [Smittium mucronatum]
MYFQNIREAMDYRSVFLDSSMGSYFYNTFTKVFDPKENVPDGYTPTYIENLWLSIFEGRNEALTFGVILTLHHIITFYLRYTLLHFAGKIPFLKKYKIQQEKEITDKQWWKCFLTTLKSQLLFQPPLTLMFLPIAKHFGLITSLPFPSLETMIPQIICFFFMEDFYHYWVHRMFHWGPLYRAMHKVHHEFSAPSGIATEYAHPIETLVFVFGVILGPLIYCKAFGNVHVITIFVWTTAKLFQSIEAHSGYDFPFSINYFFPLWANADHHDFHHMAFVNNFSSSFIIWDRVFGTDLRYLRFREKRYKSSKLELGLYSGFNRNIENMANTLYCKLFLQ